MRTTWFGMVMAMALVSAPAWGQVLFFDDFNDGTPGTDVTGTTPNVGGVWEEARWGQLGPFAFGTAAGVGGTQGLARAGGNADRWSTTSEVLTSGSYVMSADLTLAGGGEIQPFLTTAGGGSSITFLRIDTRIQLQGIYYELGGRGFYEVDTGVTGGQLHIELGFDLDNETGTLSWFEIGNPSNGGFEDLGPFWDPSDDGTYALSEVLINVNGADGNGIDNFMIAVPEPASLALLGLGGLVMIRRRRA